MNYVILKKDSIVQPINIVSDSSGDEIRSLKEQGFKIVCENLEALSSGEAIKKFESNTVKTNDDIEVIKQNPQSNYAVAQLVVKILSFIGWATMFIGILLVLVGFSSATDSYNVSFMQLIAYVTPGFSVMISGLFGVALAQIVKATVDNADNSYQIMIHLKSKKI